MLLLRRVGHLVCKHYKAKIRSDDFVLSQVKRFTIFFNVPLALQTTLLFNVGAGVFGNIH
jgi:hypothetical protein